MSKPDLYRRTRARLRRWFAADAGCCVFSVVDSRRGMPYSSRPIDPDYQATRAMRSLLAAWFPA